MVFSNREGNGPNYWLAWQAAEFEEQQHAHSFHINFTVAPFSCQDHSGNTHFLENGVALNKK